MNAGSRRLKGFTLIELVMVIAVAAIIVTIAVPSFSSLIAKNYQAATFNEILSLVNKARSSAVTKRSESVFSIASSVSGLEVSISQGGSVILSRNLGDARVFLEPTTFSVGFNALGRRSSCSGAGCEIDLSVGEGAKPSKLSIEPSGMILGES